MKKEECIKNHIRFAELLAKKNIGELSRDDQYQYDQLLKNNELKASIEGIKQPENSDEYFKETEQFDVVSARQRVEWKIKFQRQKRKNIIFDTIRHAAAIVPPILLALWFVYGANTMVESDLDMHTDIMPGETKAQLFLSDGRTIALDLNQERELKESGDLLIVNDNSGLKYISDKGVDSKTLVYNELKTPVGGEYSITLSDGTKVWLNAMSEIKYPVAFADNERRVAIKGEVYFDVARDENKPFIVDVDQVEVNVLGTHFNIMSYSNEKAIETTLVEGSVKIRSKESDEYVVLSPGNQARYTSSTRQLDVREVDVEQYTAWLNGKFVFEGNTLESIMKQLERWYGIEVFFVNQDLKNYRFTARLQRYDEFSEILSKLELTTNVSFEVNEKTVIIKRN